MSLRAQINLIIAALMALAISALVAIQIKDTRGSVREEVEGSNIVATQLLTRMSWIYEQAGVGAMVTFLNSVGHVRANDVSLYDAGGALVYHSPPPKYKVGRDAPEWFAALVAPSLAPTVVQISGGRLVIQADPSRAILDGWDDLARLLAIGGAVCMAALGSAFWLTRRALTPLRHIVDGLERMERGEYSTRLPTLPGTEARLISNAFNRMAQAVEESAAAKRAATAAQFDLEQNRELTLTIQSHIEEERRSISRELHDELGQSITAIKSMGLSIIQRAASSDERIVGTARLIVETAGRLFDSVHELISRLRPFAMDDFGLDDALRDLVSDLRRSHPEIEFRLTLGALPAQLGDAIATCAYRIVQESVTNALRHAAAGRIVIDIASDQGALAIRVEDNGRGLAPDWQRAGRFGVRGMRERASILGGSLELAGVSEGGVAVLARLPLY